MWAIILLTRIKRLFSSLQWKFVIAYLLVILVAFGVIAATVIQLVGESLFDQRVREEERVAGELAAQAAPLYAALNAPALQALSLEAAQKYDSRVLVLDDNGAVQVDTESLLNGHRLEIAQVAGVLGGSRGESGYIRAQTAGDLFSGGAAASGAMTGVYALPIEKDGALLGALVYVTAAQDIYEGLTRITAQIGVILAAVSAVVALLSVCIVRLFTRPVRELSVGIAQMSKGDFTARVRVRGKNEFADLARAFNTMSQRMETLDRSRNQFVSNASHELKTPLSTMKILLQTLLYQEVYDPDISHEFLNDIDKEIDRLSAVVSDLLTLVSIDSGDTRLKLAPLSLRDLIAENVKRLTPLARERGIEIDFTGRESVDTQGDAMRLAQVFYNLMDNAIKYTPRGGVLRVELSRQGKTAVARVSDNGIGIPAEDQLHIFDRFYRVDKARSRETGGTGLGLSIVKQIILMHGGSISVSSRENEGTTFTVELPITLKTAGGKGV